MSDTRPQPRQLQRRQPPAYSSQPAPGYTEPLFHRFYACDLPSLVTLYLCTLRVREFKFIIDSHGWCRLLRHINIYYRLFLSWDIHGYVGSRGCCLVDINNWGRLPGNVHSHIWRIDYRGDFYQTTGSFSRLV